jgi:hypothetical protein
MLERAVYKAFPDLRWCHASLPQPPAHRRWALNEGIRRGCELLASSGALTDPTFKKLLRTSRRDARRTFSLWLKYAWRNNIDTGEQHVKN